MLAPKSSSVIRLRGVRHNNLKNFDLDLPLHRLIVITGLSGSGKSSLAFDTLYAEGQRRYIETFSPYARQFFDRMDKPQVDSIEGIPPAIAIEQRNAVRTTRSTVGTMTEICDHMKVLWPHLAQLHCRGCGQPVRKDSPHRVWESLAARATPRAAAPPGAAATAGASVREVLVTFDLPVSEKLSLAESLGLISKQGYQRLLVNGEIVRLEEALNHAGLCGPVTALTVVQDRLKLAPASRARLVEACEHAYHFGKGRLTIWEIQPPSTILHPRPFSNRLHCASCNLEYREPAPALFSFNHPLGACPQCKGFGRVISIDYNLAIPDPSLSLAGGAVKPWRTGTGAESQTDLEKFCKRRGVPLAVPFTELSPAHQRWVVEGDEDYGIDEDHRWPRLWYGVKGYFRWLESKAYKMHVRVLLSRYRAYTPCPECNGQRLNRDAQLYLLRLDDLKSPGTRRGSSLLTLADFYAMPVRDALALMDRLAKPSAAGDRSTPIAHALAEVRARLAYLSEVGLGYLTLDRPTRTLSGGETERVNLTSCLGTRLVNTLFVLDEPSVGLHPRDTERLVRILEQLRDVGNTVVVVEHEPGVMRAADQIVDIGPGHGAAGGEVVFQGALPQLLKSARSLTGQYLSGRRQIVVPTRRPVTAQVKKLKIAHATRHNLRDFTVEIPLGRFVALTGVSGSGKTTLVREVLLPTLQSKLQNLHPIVAKASDRMDSDHDAKSDETDSAIPRASSATLTGAESLDQVVLVDQSALGKTPRSNPAVYIGAFDDIREVFAQSDVARQRGLEASAFSFNSAAGQCEKCRGAGFEKIEMQFLSDVFIRCPECQGRRYRPHILEIKIGGNRRDEAAAPKSSIRNPKSEIEWSIGDLLEATVDEVIAFLAGFAGSKPAQRARASLQLLQEVGLGYLRLGQPINTLSGGESQRLKLVRHLAEAVAAGIPAGRRAGASSSTEKTSAETRTRESSATAALNDRYPGVQMPPATAATMAAATLFLFDEPTTGLHFDDIRLLLLVFQRLVDAGHSVIVIEHNLEVIKCADWVIDLGPEAGDKGGQLMAVGPPETIVACGASHTGRALKHMFTLSTQGNS